MRGEYDIFSVCEKTGLKRHLFSHHNDLVDTWGAIAARCIAMGQVEYKLSALYVEFENVADPEDEVTVPEIDPTEGLEYYQGLSGSGVRDFLRIPLDLSPSLFTVTGYDSIPSGEGNGAQFYAITQGTAGVHGRTFSDSVNSKVFGLALVATPDWGDRTKDLVYARSYYPVDKQYLKQPSAQISVSYRYSFANA